MNKLLKNNNEFIPLLIVSLVFIYINIFESCIRDYFWGSVINDILIGVIVSYIFYLIVVYIPSRKKEAIIKSNYKRQITAFKSSIISKLLQSMSGGYIGEEGWKHEDLFINKNFKDFFHTKVSKTQDRWDQIATNLQDDIGRINDIVMEFKILEDESRFVLNNLEIKDERIYVFLKRVSKITYSLRSYNPDTDDINHIMLFLWQIFAGWSWVDGYSDKDIFQIIYDEF